MRLRDSPSDPMADLDAGDPGDEPADRPGGGPADGPGGGPGGRDFDAEFDRAVASFKAREAEFQASKGMWLSHHWPEDHDRCVFMAGRHVCRRCLALYPVALVVAVVSLAGLSPWPAALDLWFIWGLCIPATVDFVAEQSGLIKYSARRQTVTTLLLAPALGRGFGHELEDSWSWEFWGPVLVFCTLWFLSSGFVSALTSRSASKTGGRHG